MVWEVKCANCKKFLEGPGAELISPPAVNESVSVNKYNLCHNCYQIVTDWLRGKGVLT